MLCPRSWQPPQQSPSPLWASSFPSVQMGYSRWVLSGTPLCLALSSGKDLSCLALPGLPRCDTESSPGQGGVGDGEGKEPDSAPQSAGLQHRSHQVVGAGELTCPNSTLPPAASVMAHVHSAEVAGPAWPDFPARGWTLTKPSTGQTCLPRSVELGPLTPVCGDQVTRLWAGCCWGVGG